MATSTNFIGRFDHSYYGKARAIYAMRDGGTGMTDWCDTEEAARHQIPEEHRVDARNQFLVLL